MPMREPFGASIFLLHAPSDRVLLQHRTDDAPSFPGQWGMFGGSGEEQDGDDPLVAVRRELHEELGLGLDADKIVRLWDYMTALGSHRYVFLYPWPDPEYPFVQTEGQGRGWFTVPEAMDSLDLTPNARRDLEMLERYLKG
jgi:8-oxo-dGTP diphosphatase